MVVQIKNTSLSGYSSTPQEALKYLSERVCGFPDELTGEQAKGKDQKKMTEPPKKNQRKEPHVSCMLTFISTLNIHKKDISDVTK